MRVVQEKNLKFDFTKAEGLIVLDKEPPSASHCMKAVDFLVEWPDQAWFVEVKDPQDASIPAKYKKRQCDAFHSSVVDGSLVRCVLAPKLKDSFLYCYLENLLPRKRILYLVLVTVPMDDAGKMTFRNTLKQQTCIIGPGKRPWQREYVADVAVFDISSWNSLLPYCPVTRSTV